VSAGRTGKQCHERWYMHLAPNLSSLPWSYVEDRRLHHLVLAYGRRWSHIAAFMTGRSDKKIKNRFNSIFFKRRSRTWERSEKAAQKYKLLFDGMCSIPTDGMRSVPIDGMRSVPIDGMRSAPIDEVHSMPILIPTGPDNLRPDNLHPDGLDLQLQPSGSHLQVYGPNHEPAIDSKCDSVVDGEYGSASIVDSNHASIVESNHTSMFNSCLEGSFDGGFRDQDASRASDASDALPTTLLGPSTMRSYVDRHYDDLLVSDRSAACDLIGPPAPLGFDFSFM
jgi:hypothetical protein